jgi:hypothetical protein
MYLGGFSLVSCVVAGEVLREFVANVDEHPDWPTTGYISDIFVFDFEVRFLLFMFAMNLLAIVFYVAVWRVVKRQTGNFVGFLMNFGILIFIDFFILV